MSILLDRGTGDWLFFISQQLVFVVADFYFFQRRLELLFKESVATSGGTLGFNGTLVEICCLSGYF